MESQMKYGSTLFRSIDDDLNASLATADELSREFSSLMEECSTSRQVPETQAKPFSSGGTSQNVPAASFPTSPNNGGSGRYVSTPSTTVAQVPEPSHRPLESVAPSGNYASQSPLYSPQPVASPKTQRVQITSTHRSDSDSGVSYGRLTPPNQSPRTQRRASPSRLTAYNGSQKAQRSPSPRPHVSSVFSQSARVAHLPSPTVHSAFESGQRSPRTSTLPRNFLPFKQSDDGAQRPKIPTKWNETDLDASYDKKPHHTYDKTEWLRPAVPNSNWRESNLDAPPPSSRKDPQSRSGQYGYLPHNVRLTLAPDRPSSPHGSPSYGPQPIVSRISIPPASPRVQQRRPIPLSVIMRLQNPQYFVAPQPPSRGPEQGSAPYRQPTFVPSDYLPQPPPPELRQPGFYGEVLVPEDVEAELERVEPGRDHAIPEDGQAPVPRPLSPTRLQPVVAPEIEVAPDRQEVLRLRAEIPRALKRRGSVDQSRPAAKGQYKQVISKLFRRKEIRRKGEPASESSSSSDGEDPAASPSAASTPSTPTPATPQHKGVNSILRKSKEQRGSGRRAHLSPLVLLLDGALVGELETVQRAVQEMSDPSQANDEGITAIHNAICGGHYAVVEFLVRIGANVSAPDSHGWTPLHCAASCNDQTLCEYLVRNGAAVMAVTESDGATAAQKCDPYAVGFQECEGFLRGVEDAMGVENSGVLYALWGYPAQASDELSFREGDMVTILQKPEGSDWWWASLCGREGFVPNNFFGLFPKVRPKSLC
ncbi:relA-associated inhibitor [Anguilla anguilla]|uniref:relA-associated inhibitor n=1 Tax=Anguilla anguilla TaxID=7936 RepID=UPI0015B0BCBF|nr:relA-associated inhibitor [Anguilla anguilla]XP_035240951.1 relA-associated inhibitor [Anguilla anguilla]